MRVKKLKLNSIFETKFKSFSIISIQLYAMKSIVKLILYYIYIYICVNKKKDFNYFLFLHTHIYIHITYINMCILLYFLFKLCKFI